MSYRPGRSRSFSYKGGVGRRNSAPHYQHQNTRTVQFQPQSKRGQSFKKKSFRGAPQAVVRSLLEDDVNMDIARNLQRHTSSRGRFNNYNRRGHNRSRSAPTRYRSIPTLPPSNWYECTVYHGQQYDKEQVLSLLSSHIGNRLEVIEYNVDDQNATFFLREKDTAMEVKMSNGHVYYPSGYRMGISVRASKGPSTSITDEVIKAITICMSNRYNVDMKSLDLSQFDDDQELLKQKIFINLTRINVMEKVLDIIGEHIPELTALNLSSNNLVSLSNLIKLSDKAVDLTFVDLSNNQLRNSEELRHIHKLQLVELKLTGNPFADRLKDKSDYVSIVRKKFPKLRKLDDEVLPAPVTFDLEVPTSLPPIQGSYFAGNPQVESLLGIFLQQYISVFDSSDRTGLINAYHEDAMFSTSVHINIIGNFLKTPFGDRFLTSRNLLKVKERAKRLKLLRMGRVNVVAALQTLPQTKHHQQSLKVDVLHLGPAVMIFQLTGMFLEKFRDRDQVRLFSRTFVTIPHEGGLLITNDTLNVTNPTSEQSRAVLASPSPVTQPSQASSPSSAPGSVVNSPTASQPLNEATRREMIQQFAIVSSMNAKFSEMCLLNNNWNYEEAGKSFLAAKEAGTIPPEAYAM